MGDGVDRIVSLTEVRDQLELNLRLIREVEQVSGWCRGVRARGGGS
jgi:hypothetical protein